MYEVFESLRDFLERGGWVLGGIFITAMFLWLFILERYLYLWFVFPRHMREAVERWEARTDKTSWYAHRIRRYLVSEVSAQLNRNLIIIKTLIALCPFLGILGTVYGMITVFDIMAVFGTGNARAMASGIAKATLPTMAGLVTALSGVYFSARLQAQAEKKAERVDDELIFE